MRLLLVVIALIGALAPAGALADVQPRPDLQRHFDAAGTTGTMVISHRGSDPETVVVGTPRSHARFLPSSTFKIPNSLLAIDKGVATGPQHPYPGPNPNFVVDGAPLLPAACEGDLTLATAFAFSCIPIYQHIARRLGWDVYERELRQMHYGNTVIHQAPLDSFWLEGRLGISALEQVRFLERLRRGTLDLSPRAMAGVRDMLVVERSEDMVLRAKTGYVFSTSPRTGWWVGWLERGSESWSFALNMDMTQPSHFAARAAIGKAILRELGAYG